MEVSTLTRAFRNVLGGLSEPVAGSDAELLERFVSRHDEAAFTALVHRHGPMVFRLCRRMLANPADAEDAFQAAFLVLARRASAIIKRPSLASWLHGVTRYIVLEARRSGSRRRTREQPLEETSEDVPSREQAPVAESDLRPILDEELARLPERYRAPIVLCYLEGRSVDEAAAELRCPRGTVATRMSRGRDLLRKRLTRRGLALSAAALTAQLAETTAGAAIPAATLHALVPAGLVAGTGIREGAAILAKQALQGIFWSKARWAGALLACLLVFGTASVKWAASSKPAASANVNAGQGDEFYVRWRFDDGPPKDIRVLGGKWEWQRDTGTPGAMSTAGANLLLPTRIPKRPFVLSVNGKVKLRQRASCDAHWSDGTRAYGCKQWYNESVVVKPDPDGRLHHRFFFLGPWKLLRWDGERNAIVRLARHRAPYPGERLVLTFQNWVTEEIELRSLRPEDLPKELCRVEQTIQTLTPGPDFPETTIPLLSR